MQLELCFLGRFAATAQGAPPRIVQISAPKRRAFLAYLAMQPSGMETRERLASLLWGDSVDRQARQSLRQCIALLRKELGPDADALIIERDAIGLDASCVTVDAREFLALANSSAADDLERALALYRGEFLDGLDVDAEPFVDWIRVERTRLSGAAARVLEVCAQRRDRAGQGVEAIGLAERLVAFDPTREHAQRLLLRLCARYRGRDAALAQADALLAFLRKDVDADPEPETSALIEDIRNGVIAPVAPTVVRASSRTGDTAEQPAPLLDEAVAPAPVHTTARPAVRSSRARRSWLAVAGALAGALVLALVSRDRLSPVQTTDARAARGSETTAADQSWRSPTIMPGIGVDQAALAAQGRYALVVLPFTAESDGPSALADRLSDNLINALSRIPALRVISRATSRLYRGRNVDVAAIGAELGVRYVVEGSVRLDDSRLRIDIVLTDPSTRLAVWSERFERDRGEQFTVEDDIARAIGRQLQMSVLANEDRRQVPTAGTDPDVAALLIKGWSGIVRIAETGTISGADEYFEAALKRDPQSMSALTGLGAYNVSVVAMFLVAEPGPYLARAQEALKRAVSLDPDNSLAHHFRGILYKMRGDHQAALNEFIRTLALNPSHAPAYAQLGHVLCRFGRLDEGIDHVRYAIRLSPKDPSLGLWTLFGAQIELERGHDAVAMEWMSRAASLDPRSPFMHASLAAAFALKGDRTAAAREVAETRKLAPWITMTQINNRIGFPRLLKGLRLAFGDPAS